MPSEIDWFQWLVVTLFVVTGVAFATHPKKVVEISRRYSALRWLPRSPEGRLVRAIRVVLVLLALFATGAMLPAR